MDDSTDIFDSSWIDLCRRAGSLASSAHCHELVDENFQKLRERQDI